jgi:probable biosynthetic protein (TIGR04098 family)
MAQPAMVETPTRSAVRTAQTDVIGLGMPQLALAGLSEGWLMRECGSRHWSAIAAHFQVPPERLTDGAGHRLYPSFLATRLTGNALGAFGEGDSVELRTQLTRLSRNRFLSRHRVSARHSRTTVAVEMISALLKRERAQDNTSLREGDARRRHPFEEPEGPEARCDLLADDKAMRSRLRGGRLDVHDDGDVTAAGPVFRYRYRPLPASDFNGAGLLYFASYHAIVDRAEWERRPVAAGLAWTTTRRDAFFFANLNPGDQIDVVLAARPAGPQEHRHRAGLFRVSDGRLMAEVATVKAGPR